MFIRTCFWSNVNKSGTSKMVKILASRHLLEEAHTDSLAFLMSTCNFHVEAGNFSDHLLRGQEVVQMPTYALIQVNIF